MQAGNPIDIFESKGAPTRREWLIVGLVFAVGAFLRFYKLDLGYFSLHTTRDLYRTLLMMHGIEYSLLGSEVHFGGRVLGPVMYVMCMVPMAAAVHPLALAGFIATINTLMLPVLWFFSRRFLGPTVALWLVAMYAVFPLEIAQLRFNWNPSFIPTFVAGFLFCMWGALIARRHWAWFGAVVFLVLAFQIHLSAFMLLFTLVPLMVVARYRPPAAVVAAAAVAVLLLFTPAIVSELRSDSGSNVVAVVTSPDSQRGPIERFTPNPNGFRNFFHHVHLNWAEREWDKGFTYLLPIEDVGLIWIGDRKMWLAATINAFSKVQLVFWMIGVAVCLHQVRRFRRAKLDRGTTEYDTAVRGMLPFLTLLLMQIIPVVFLTFFRFGGEAGSAWNVSPMRYYLVSYPAQFLTTAIGIVVAGRVVIRWTEFFGEAQVSISRFVRALGVTLVISHVVFALLYLQVIERSGRIVGYNFPNYAPNIRSMLQMRELLLADAGLDIDAWYDRTHSQHLFDYRYGEVTLDWVLSQDARSITNPAPDPHLRWLLYSWMPNQPWPVLPEGAVETRRWEVHGVGMTLIEYRMEDPAFEIPDNIAMRNYYYQNERMLYLGKDAEVRRLARERHPVYGAP